MITHNNPWTAIGGLLERILFSRDDALFIDVDWETVEAETLLEIDGLLPTHRQFIIELSSLGITDAWSHRKATETDLNMPVKDALRLWSYSNDDGLIYRVKLKEFGPKLYGAIRQWIERWKLATPWMYLVAGETLCVAADRQTCSTEPVASFVLPSDWRTWYANLSDTWISKEELSISAAASWNPRIETRTSAPSRTRSGTSHGWSRS